MPNWKRRRLIDYDYSTGGAYFVTICVKNKENMLWKKDVFLDDEQIQLTTYGKIVKDEIEKISEKYTMVSVDKYVVMPNHIHMILLIDDNNIVSLSTLINQTKGKITRQIGFSIWQKSFHDHIIRDHRDYDLIWNYINENPRKWREDKYFMIND